MTLWEATASPSSPFREVGTLEVLEAFTHHFASQYPGADVWTDVPPQVVPLECNGYEVRARLEGTVSARGYYGGEVGVPGVAHVHLYAYEADALLTGEIPSWMRGLEHRYRLEVTA